jgi:predicted porin
VIQRQHNKSKMTGDNMKDTSSFRPTLMASGLFAALSAFCGASQAIEFGPDNMFKFYGFGEVTVTRANNQCLGGTNGCQFDPDTDRQRIWTDAVVPGLPLGTRDKVFNQVQVWLEAQYKLGKGYTVKGVVSQNFRDGKVDSPHFWRERNLSINHEDYGTLTIGAMTSRTWGFADYPYGSNLGLSYSWAATGAGYRNLGHAIRYTSRPLDVADGDLVLEATYDRGNRNFTINKPSFVELWGHYGRGPLSVDAMYQDARNGSPAAFGAAVFDGLFYTPVADSKVGSSGQSVAVLQAAYQLNSKIEVSGGVRRNRWSGAYAAVVIPGPPAQFNNMFNVDWGGTLNGVPNPGYPATSSDFTAGVRYRMDKWTFATGLVYLGKANTANPSERGQSNAALINTVRASYAVTPDLEVSGFAGMIHFKNKGLSPLSMPSNSTINNIDSRVTKVGNWVGLGAKYSF